MFKLESYPKSNDGSGTLLNVATSSYIAEAEAYLYFSFIDEPSN